MDHTNVDAVVEERASCRTGTRSSVCRLACESISDSFDRLGFFCRGAAVKGSFARLKADVDVGEE